MTPSITTDQLYTAVGTFIQTVLGVDPATSVTVAVTRGQINRVSMPNTAFVNMWLADNDPLRTNVDTWQQSAQTQTTETGTRVKMRVDFYGPLSNDWQKAVTALWRDYYGAAQLAPVCAPLYYGNAVHATLIDGEEQYEDRWIVDLFLQYNPQFVVSQQTANPPLKITVVNVEQKYPPT
jgi:hypothetical protein